MWMLLLLLSLSLPLLLVEHVRLVIVFSMHLAQLRVLQVLDSMMPARGSCFGLGGRVGGGGCSSSIM